MGRARWGIVVGLALTVALFQGSVGVSCGGAAQLQTDADVARLRAAVNGQPDATTQTALNALNAQLSADEWRAIAAYDWRTATRATLFGTPALRHAWQVLAGTNLGFVPALRLTVGVAEASDCDTIRGDVERGVGEAAGILYVTLGASAATAAAPPVSAAVLVVGAFMAARRFAAPVRRAFECSALGDVEPACSSGADAAVIGCRCNSLGCGCPPGCSGVLGCP